VGDEQAPVPRSFLSLLLPPRAAVVTDVLYHAVTLSAFEDAREDESQPKLTLLPIQLDSDQGYLRRWISSCAVRLMYRCVEPVSAPVKRDWLVRVPSFRPHSKYSDTALVSPHASFGKPPVSASRHA
jgi:hypothetical protein